MILNFRILNKSLTDCLLTTFSPAQDYPKEVFPIYLFWWDDEPAEYDFSANNEKVPGVSGWSHVRRNLEYCG